jgi:hypothetical protein
MVDTEDSVCRGRPLLRLSLMFMATDGRLCPLRGFPESLYSCRTQSSEEQNKSPDKLEWGPLQILLSDTGPRGYVDM